MATERRRLPAELAQIAQEGGDDGQPVRSLVTLARWKRKGPPAPIRDLLTTESGRKLLRTWVDQAEEQDQPQAA